MMHIQIPRLPDYGRQQTWAGGAPAASSVGGRGMGGGEEGALMLPLLPEGIAPVAHTQQHIVKERGPLQADDSTIVASHTCLAVVRMLITLQSRCPLSTMFKCACMISRCRA